MSRRQSGALQKQKGGRGDEPRRQELLGSAKAGQHPSSRSALIMNKSRTMVAAVTHPAPANVVPGWSGGHNALRHAGRDLHEGGGDSAAVGRWRDIQSGGRPQCRLYQRRLPPASLPGHLSHTATGHMPLAAIAGNARDLKARCGKPAPDKACSGISRHRAARGRMSADLSQ